MKQSNDPNSNREIADGSIRTAARADSKLNADPEMKEGPATPSRVAIYGVAIVIVLGAVFYGMSVQLPAPTDSAQSMPPSAPTSSASVPNARDVTPNREPGTTVGSAPVAQQDAPKSNPTGSEVDREKAPVTR